MPGFSGFGKDFCSQLTYSCVQESLSREVRQRLQWIQEARQQLDSIIAKLRCCEGQALDETVIQLRELSYDVTNRQVSVAALVKQTRQHLAHDPDTLLYLDVTQLETSWALLSDDILALIRAQNSPPTSVKKKVNFIYVSPKSEISPIQPKFEFVGSPTKKIGVNVPKNGSLLREKGRTHVTKLSIPYRVFIKSRLKSRWRRGSSWESSSASDASTLTGSDPQSSLSEVNEECVLANFSQVESSNIDAYSSVSEEDDVSSGFSDIDWEENGPGDLSSMKSSFPQSTTSLYRPSPTMASTPSISPSRPSPSSSPLLGTRASPCGEVEDPVLAKRRRVDKLDHDVNKVLDSPITPRATLKLPTKNTLGFSPRVSPGISPRDSPTPFDIPFGMNSTNEDLGCRSFDDLTDSNMSSLSGSPSREGSPAAESAPARGLSKKYRSNELWSAIRNDYKYLMDKEIIETCKSTESDLSWESDDVSGTNHKVSLAEFMQQYKEMIDWLNQIGLATQRCISSNSEKYLNQTYHEEMLERSPRRKVFSEYARQLMRRYPCMKEEINARLTHLNNQWSVVMDAIAPLQTTIDERVMRQDLQLDLADLRVWLQDVETKLSGLDIQDEWTPDDMRQTLTEHQVLQKSIESHSKVVSAVLKLADRLSTYRPSPSPSAQQSASVNSDDKGGTASQLGTEAGHDEESREVDEQARSEASQLEQRWHSVWLLSLEWQCRLEEALTHGKKRRRSVKPGDISDWGTYTCTTPHQQVLSLSRPQSQYSDSEDERQRNQFDIDGLSDHGANSDVIPFSESEYEKIVDEACEEKVSSASQECVKARNHGRSSGSIDDGSDSALGRSVSDERNINSKDKTTSAQSVTSVATLASKSSQTGFKVSPDEMRKKDSASVTKKSGMKDMCADVGYASESHSNEEHDVKNKGRLSATSHLKTALECPESMMRHVDSPGKETSSVWRNSMTSAYDTSSNGSDHDSSIDGAVARSSALPSVDANENMQRMTALRPSEKTPQPQSVYRLTAIETDSEPTSSAVDNVLPKESQSEAATDDDVSLSSPDLPYDSQAVAADDLCPDGTTKSHINIDDLLVKLNRLKEDPRKTTDKMTPESLDNNGSHALFEMEPDSTSRKDDCSSSQGGSNISARCRTLVEDELNANIRVPTSAKPSSLTNLVQEMESFARDPELWNMKTSSPATFPRTRKRKGKHKLSGGSVQMIPQSPSCDASSEGTASDLSLSSDELIGRSTRSTSTSQRATPGKDITPRSARKRRGGNDISVERQSNSPKYFVSESAIHDLDGNSSGGEKKLRRTISDMTSQSKRNTDSPRKIKTRRTMRKSRSSMSVSDDTTRTEMSSSPGRASRSQSHTSTEKTSQLSCDTGDESVDSIDYCPAAASGVKNGVNFLLRRDKTSPAARSLPVAVPEIARSGPLADTDDTDALAHSLNSTVESFSEHAWDSYQDPPYPSASSDPGEEKLDASKLQADWEHDLDEDFMISAVNLRNKAAHRLRTSGLNDSTRTLGESEDSDIEDFHDVIGESRKAASFTKSILDKFRRELVDSSEYTDPIVTCQTNIKCLQEVLDTLHAEGGLDLDTDQLYQVQDLISLFRGLKKQAEEQQREAVELNRLHRDLRSTQVLLDDVTVTIDTPDFDSITDLENNMKRLQQNRLELESRHQEKLATLSQEVMNFSLCNQDIDLTQFKHEILNTQRNLEGTLEKSSSRVSQLQTGLVAWHKFQRSREELGDLLEEEECRLDSLDEEKLLEALESSQNVHYRIEQLQTSHDTLSELDEKLACLRKLAADISPVCSTQVSLALQAEISLCNHDIATTVSRCKEMLITTEAKLAEQDQASNVTVPEAIPKACESDPKREPTTIMPADAAKKSNKRNLWKLLVYMLPLPLAIFLFIGLVCVIDGTADSSFDIFFTPWLRYVNGPPPT